MRFCFVPVFLFVLLLSGCGERRTGGGVILIIVDTLRSDHLGCYGYHRDTTPSIDSLAGAGVRYTSVTAGEPWTLPSMATIFTGLLPLEHNARRRGENYYGLAPEAVTLTEYMTGAGYITAAFFNVIFMNADFGFHQGFDHFDCHNALGTSEDRDAGTTVTEVFRWIDSEYTGDGPLFLAVHFYDPHLTYAPPDSFADLWRDIEYQGDFDSSWGQRETVVNVNKGLITLNPDDLFNLVALYDGEVAYTDSQIGRLLAGLRQRGITDDALVILVADHGEEFLDHGKMGHAHSLYQELVNVPLIVSGRGFSPGSVSELTISQADILPTVLGWCSIENSYGGFGQDLLSEGFPAHRAVPSGMNMEGGYRVTSREGDLKVHLADRGNLSAMFDLSADPGEHHPLDLVDEGLFEKALYYLGTPPLHRTSAVMVENVFLDALKNLGYI